MGQDGGELMLTKVFWNPLGHNITRTASGFAKAEDAAAHLPADHEHAALVESEGWNELDWLGDEQGIYRRITLACDKPTIKANGVDAATLTATIPDPTSAETITFTVDGGAPIAVPAVGGVAQLVVDADAPGQIRITVTSSTKYGQRDIVLEATP